MARWVAVGLLSVVALQWLSLVGASHFRFGSISWAPSNSYSNSIDFTFRLAFRRSFSSSYNCDQSTISNGSLLGSGGSWRAQCVNYYGYDSQCNSANIADTGFRCTDYSSNEDWSIGENNFTHLFPSIHEEWLVSYSSCCWISLSGQYGSSSWLVSTTVNLTRRSDNGRINSSPKSRSPAIVRWHEGCPSSLRIPVEDPDGDVVKCRFAHYSESYKYSYSFPYGTLDEETCVLTYNGRSGAAGIYAVALTIEDFPAGTTNFGSVSPFSAVGLQFLVLISSHSGSCSNVPVFTASTPLDGECSEVQIGSAYKTVIEVKLADFSKHIVEIVTSSPPGMQLSSLRYHGGVYYRNVTWNPGQYQVGQQSFCFKAVDSSSMGTEWRCVTILVGISSTPHVITGSHTPRNPISKTGLGFIWWSVQFDRVIKKPRTSSYIRLVLLPSGHTIYKVDTLSSYVRISSDYTTLQFAMPNAALSMNGSYAILIDHGAVVGQGCSYDGPPTPGITNTSDWNFVADGVCPVGYYLAPPEFKSCVDMNECGPHSRSKRSHYYWWWSYSMSSVSTSVSPSISASISASASASISVSASISQSVSASAGSCSRYIYSPFYTYVHSPGYPGCYPNNEVCTWLIVAPVGNYIELYIYQFNLEYGNSNCPWDYLEIRDGDTLSSPLITKSCGSLGHFVIYSSGRFLFLRFVSDSVIQMPGFSAWCTTVSQTYGNTIPSAQLSSRASASCVSSHTPATWLSTTSFASTSESSTFRFSWTTSSPPITPTMSSSYVPFSVSYPDNRVGFNNSVILGKNVELLANFTNLMKPVVQSGNDWRLCWRASQDGWASNRFHSLCDGKGPTITIIKVGQYIFGGYTSISWRSSCSYRYDAQAYLFSLVNKPGWAPVKLNQTGQYSYYKSASVYSCYSYGPTFGGGYDIYISGYSAYGYSYLGHTYDSPSNYGYWSSFAQTFLAGSFGFTPDEIEIFYDETFISQAIPFPTSTSVPTTMSVPTTTSLPLAITPTTSSSYVPFSVSYPDNRVGFNNSVILGKNAELLVNFTNLMKPVVQNGNEWRLCWRASQDGWASTRFHSLCDGKGPTVTIIKVGQYIFGGYASISWSSHSCRYRYDAQAYLFSLVNKPGWAPLKLNQTGQYSYFTYYSVVTCSFYGPTFGGGHDLYISSYPSSSSSCYSNLGSTYSPPSGFLYGSNFTQTFLAGSYRFTPDEIEVFYDETFTSQAPPFLTSTSLPTTMSVPTTTRLPPASQIAPTSSSSVSSIRYVSSSSYVLPTPMDFQLHVPADCAQICTNSPGSYSCSCVSGYRLASDGKSCLDIDECATNNGGCSHHCNNIPGSFYCGCPEGTTMAVNNLTCVEPGVTVTCDESNMTVSLEKQSFPFFPVSELHLLYSSCRATQNSTHILISTSLNGCGTLVNETAEELIFWNEIQVDAVIIDNVITRTHDINLPFYCSYSRRKMLSLSFSPRNIFIGSEAGYGNFTMRMDFYKTADFATPYSGNDFPIEVSLNENLYVMLSVESSADLVIMAENCKATKDGNFYSWPQYSIIQNGCPRDTAMQYTYYPTQSFQQIIIPAFRFFNDYDVVYFHCELLACYRYNSNSRCSNSCLNSKRRKRRDVNRDELKQEESTTKHLLTSGPITKKSQKTKKSENGDTGQSKQAALIGGAAAAGGFGLIAVVALAVLFVKYRIARRLMNRNKVGDLYTTKEEQMSRKNAYIQEDDMIEKEDSF